MFCPNCGNNLPDDANRCNSCGYQLSRTHREAQPQQPAYQQPAYEQPQYQQPPVQQPPVQQPQYQPYGQPAYQPQPAPYRPQPAPAPISKKEYLKTKAPEAVKKNAGIVTITFILTLVLIFASAIAPLAMEFFDIPAMSLIMEMAEADPDELTEELEDAYDEAEYRFEMNKSEMDKDERQAAKKVLDSMDTLLDHFSILNLTGLLNVVGSEGEDYMDSDTLDELEEVNSIMTGVIVFIVSGFLLPLVFAILGGLNKSTALTVTALVFTCLSQLSLCGFIWVVMSLVLFIIQAVLCSKITKAYNDFRVGRFA